MTDAEKNKTRQANLNASSGQADKRLKEAHLDEWNKYMLEETKKRGEKWAPKLKPEERAEAELRALLEANPALAAKVPEILGQPQLPTDDLDTAVSDAMETSAPAK